jgi:hypothetical protein
MAHQQAEPPQRSQGRPLADEKSEMRTIRALDPERDQAAEIGIGDRMAAVEETWVES